MKLASHHKSGWLIIVGILGNLSSAFVQIRIKKKNALPGLHWIQTDTLMVFPKEFAENVNFEKSQQMTTKHARFPACKELSIDLTLYSIGYF